MGWWWRKRGVPVDGYDDDASFLVGGEAGKAGAPPRYDNGRAILEKKGLVAAMHRCGAAAWALNGGAAWAVQARRWIPLA